MGKTRLFANDFIYKPIQNTKDCLQQDDLYRLAEWEDIRSGEMQYPKSHQKKITSAAQLYTERTDPPYRYEQSKYLGVDITTNLSWNAHIDGFVKKGNSLLGFLQRNLRVNSQETKASAYFTLV